MYWIVDSGHRDKDIDDIDKGDIVDIRDIVEIGDIVDIVNIVDIVARNNSLVRKTYKCLLTPHLSPPSLAVPLLIAKTA